LLCCGAVCPSSVEILRTCHQGKWPQAVEATNSERMEKAYNIVTKMPQFEEERNQFLAVLRLLNAKVERLG